jgi:hypothetical protein
MGGGEEKSIWGYNGEPGRPLGRLGLYIVG